MEMLIVALIMFGVYINYLQIIISRQEEQIETMNESILSLIEQLDEQGSENVFIAKTPPSS
jgi:hypothetical protein